MTTNSQKLIDYKNIKLFKGLNSLRFIAAVLVVMHHGETIKKKRGIENMEWLGLFGNGGNAVTFFFVLSGFLITYLLLKENGKTGSIRIRNFYLKRVLRIWPLYFLLVFIGTVALPFLFLLLHVNYEMPYTLAQTWFYFVFFLPGLVTFFFGTHFLEPLWSIGIEEVFYLIWAPLFKPSKPKILTLLVSVIVIKMGLSLFAYFFIKNELIVYTINIFKFEAMAIGGLGAYFIYNKGNWVSQLFVFKLPFQILFILLILTYLFFHSNIDNFLWNKLFKTPVLSAIFVESLFLYIIICVSVVDHSIIKLESKLFSFLGEISYGIYMYHLLVIFTIILFLKKYLMQMSLFLSLTIFYAVTILLTIILASLSKRYFENYFLRLKDRLDSRIN